MRTTTFLPGQLVKLKGHDLDVHIGNRNVNVAVFDFPNLDEGPTYFVTIGSIALLLGVLDMPQSRTDIVCVIFIHDSVRFLQIEKLAHIGRRRTHA